MASAGRNGCGVHLVGSVPLEGSEAVFRATAAALGPWLERLPDGETGRRTNWIEWQIPMLGSDPALEVGAARSRSLSSTPAHCLPTAARPISS